MPFSYDVDASSVDSRGEYPPTSAGALVQWSGLETPDGPWHRGMSNVRALPAVLGRARRRKTEVRKEKEAV